MALHKAKLFKEYVEQATLSMQEIPLNAQLLMYYEQVAAEGLVIVSVHYLALQFKSPVTHPQAFPAPSVVALQRRNELNK